jgi:antitoxin MazE
MLRCIYIVSTIVKGDQMELTVAKWGNSLAVRIPQGLAKEISIQEGTEVDLSVIDGTLIIKPAYRKRYSLEELVSGITPENRHDEVDWGEAVGNEYW